jgi:hypothetical protein
MLLAEPVDSSFRQGDVPAPVSLAAKEEAEQQRRRVETEAEIRKQEEQILNMRKQLDEQKAVLSIPSKERAAAIVQQDLLQVAHSAFHLYLLGSVCVLRQAKNAALQAEKEAMEAERAQQ